jgi:hypothetical protein
VERWRGKRGKAGQWEDKRWEGESEDEKREKTGRYLFFAVLGKDAIFAIPMTLVLSFAFKGKHTPESFQDLD